MHFNQPCGLDKLTQVTFTATGKLITRGPVRQVGGALRLSAPIESLLALSPPEIKDSRQQIIELDLSRHSVVPRESRDNTDRVNGSKNGAFGSPPTNLKPTSCQLLCSPILSPPGTPDRYLRATLSEPST